MDLLDPVRSDSPTASAPVAALVVIHEGSALREALAAVERQVYEPKIVMVVGGASAAVREAAGAHEVVGSVTEALAALDSTITHVWLLHDDSIPRPDALGALVAEGGRVGAALVGSKILKAGQPGMLESVGLATDVFEVPASGLDTEEHDQEQYDVLRDVAFVAGSSMLVDRALLDVTGGPDPRLEPITAALDLCQRVRLAGGRVVVVPSAEVLHDGSCVGETKQWRLEAGRIRSMLKAYSPVTLLWVVPFNFGLGLMEAIVSPLFGRWRLFTFLRAWLWNLIRLPSTIAARRRVVRETGDDELFRFQVRGSARLTAFWQRAADKALRLTESERLRSLGRVVGGSQDPVRRPVVVWLLSGVTFALIATRALWADGVASAGYALTPPSSVSAAIAAVAGGWNPADLGSPEPLRPVVGAMSLVQVALFGRASLALVVVLVAAAIAGVVGTARLLGPFGVRPAARYSAGIFLVGGPAVRVLADGGVWHGIVAMAVLPWILSVIVHRERAAPAVAAVALLTAIGAAFLPLMLLAPTIAIVVWSLVDPTRSPVLLQRSLAGAVLAIPALLPWVGAINDPAFVFTSGPDFYWSPSAWIVGALLILAAAGLSTGDAALSRLTGWGALMAAGGALLARMGGFGWGTDPGAAGMAMAGVGMALVVGAGLETGARWLDVGGVVRGVRLAAAVLGAALVVGTTTLAIPGRLGFPASGLSDVLSFTTESGAGRAILIGDESAMPGGGILLAGDVSYRVVSTPEPRLWEAWPTRQRLGDEALTEVLRSALAGAGFRLGEGLTEFGVKWVVATGPGPVVDALDAQLDLLPLALPDTLAYQVEGDAPRAIDDSGVRWTPSGTDFVGPAAGGTVRLAENADSRWADQWVQDGWANRVTVDTGLITFGPIQALRTAALAALVWLGLLVVGVAAFRGRSR